MCSDAKKLIDCGVYNAVYGFVDFLYEEMGWRNLAGLLGSIWERNGVPLSFATRKDWNDYVSKLSERMLIFESITSDQAYKCMLLFLDSIFRGEAEESLEVVINGMLIENNALVNNKYLDYWNESYKKAVA